MTRKTSAAQLCVFVCIFCTCLIQGYSQVNSLKPQKDLYESFDIKAAIEEAENHGITESDEIMAYVMYKKKEYKETNLQGYKHVGHIETSGHKHNHGSGSRADPPCYNVGVENNDFTNWSGLIGSYGKPGFPGLVLNKPGLRIDSVHTIMETADGFDPVVQASGINMPVTSPGSNYSLKLGNDRPTYGAEQASIFFYVDSANRFFTYEYAVVLNDPVGHSIQQKPFFSTYILDQAGDTVPCSPYKVIADRNNPEFVPIQNGNVVYRNWTTTGIDLIDYIGQTLTIYFTTGDCQQGGHFGYAYVDAFCGPLPELESDPICDGDQVTYTAPDFFNAYSWNGVPGSFTRTYSNLTDGQVVSVTMTTEQGCQTTLTDTVQIKENPDPNFTFTTVCLNGVDSVNFTDLSTSPSANIINWDWAFGDGGISGDQNPGHLYGTPGPHNVTLTVFDDEGCQADTIIPLTLDPDPVALFSVDPVCHNIVSSLNDASTIASGSIIDWDWSIGNPEIASSTDQNPTFTFSDPGTYDIQLVVTSDGGCKDTITGQATVYKSPLADFVNDTVCLGNTNQFTDQSTTEDGVITSWDWDFGDPSSGSNTDNGQNPMHTYGTNGASGPYDAQLIVTTDLGCADTINYMVVIDPLPTAAFSVDGVCMGVTSSFADESTINSPFTIDSWEWDFGDGSGTSADQNPSYVYAIDSTYDVQLIVTTNRGCKDTTINPAIVYPIPLANFGPFSEGCLPHEVDFDDSSVVSSTNITKWFWDFGHNGASSTEQFPSYTYTEEGTYSVSLIIETEFGCKDTLLIPDMIVVHGLPDANFTFDPPKTTIFDPEISFYDGSTDAVQWIWDFGDEDTDADTSSLKDPIYEYQDTGKFCPKLVIVNNFGCRDSIVKCLIIDPDWIFYVPNAFTPDGDGNNDFFIGQGINVIEHRMWIYDRWGVMIYKTDDTETGTVIPWNGKVQGSGPYAQQDTYVYVVRVTDIFGDSHKYVGHVSLIR